MGKRRIRCQICYEACNRKNRPVVLLCTCEVCRKCLATWVKSSCKAFAGTNFAISCPKPDHKATISPVFLKMHLSKHDFHLYELTTLKRILLLPAYRQCPHCKLIAWAEVGLCFSSFYCPRCDFVWKSSISAFISSISAVKNEIYSVVTKDFISSPCPSCSSPISKQGGCSHMTCSMCKASFCSLCGAYYAQHSNERCTACVFHYVLWTVILLIILLCKVGALVPVSLLKCVERYGDAVGWIVVILIILCVVVIMHLIARVDKHWSRGKLVRLLAGVDIAAGGVLYLILRSGWEDIGQVAGMLGTTCAFAVPAAVYSIRFSRFT